MVRRPARKPVPRAMKRMAAAASIHPAVARGAAEAGLRLKPAGSIAAGGISLKELSKWARRMRAKKTRNAAKGVACERAAAAHKEYDEKGMAGGAMLGCP